MSHAAPTLDTPSVERILRPRTTNVAGIRIIEAFTWLFENPKWVNHSVIAAVILNFPLFPLPILGQIVVMGYLFGCLEDELRQPRFGYADFDFKKFGLYLKRGIFPWLINLCITSVGVAIVLFIFVPMLISGVTLINTRDQLWMMLGGFVIGLGYMIYIAALVVVSLLPVPLMLRVGVTQNVREAFEIRWAMSFFRKLLPELFLTVFVISLTTLPLMLMGFVACVVGAWFVAAWLYFVGFRILIQLYELFLARGGEPIPFPTLPPPNALGPGADLPSSEKPSSIPQAPVEKISPFRPATG
jgi:hypothetical protein